MKRVLDSRAIDISSIIEQECYSLDLDPIVLLGLLFAESGYSLNPYAERWGSRTAEAKNLIQREDFTSLQTLIWDTFPDISFGYSQRIVLYHESGNRSSSVDNVLWVREHVFSNPEEDIHFAAQRLKNCYYHFSCDGSALSALVVYNAGSDRRNDQEWMQRWGGNVTNYKNALLYAEEFRDMNADLKRIEDSLNIIWGWSSQLEPVVKEQIINEIRNSVIAIKEEVGI